jgi:hypothetical protein
MSRKAPGPQRAVLEDPDPSGLLGDEEAAGVPGRALEIEGTGEPAHDQAGLDARGPCGRGLGRAGGLLLVAAGKDAEHRRQHQDEER